MFEFSTTSIIIIAVCVVAIILLLFLYLYIGKKEKQAVKMTEDQPEAVQAEQKTEDKPETVQKRLSVYHEQTQPLIDFYNNAGILKTVDGTQDVDVVFNSIMQILK